MELREKLISLLKNDIDYNLNDIYIWGTGNTSDLYQEGLKRLEKEGIIIKGYFDNDLSKIGKTYNDKMVFDKDYISQLDNPFILVASPRWNTIKQIANYLDQKNVKWMPIDSFVVKTHSEQILQVFDLLDDNKSKRVFVSLIESRVSDVSIPEELIDDNQYFYYNFMNANPNEVFVDCGAYVGDSFEQYLWKRCGVFKKAILIEPDKRNIDAINERIIRLKKEWNISDDKIQILPYGLSDTDSKYYLLKNEGLNGLSSKITDENKNDSEECEIVALDSILNNEKYYIKADIESYEYKMLLGAKNTIVNNKPMIAVCIYHNSVDLYSIPLLIHSLCDDYKLSIRHYTPNLSETVLYAYC